MIRKYPEDCIQNFCEPWWTEDKSNRICRGKLIRAFLPHVDQIPQRFEPVGRTDPASHSSAKFVLSELRMSEFKSKPPLPVAAIPVFKGETHIAVRAKKRPAVVICSGGESIPKNLTVGKAKWPTKGTILVAPYYGADEGGKRSGISPILRQRIKCAMYPQFFIDFLPIPDGPDESFCKLDHIQPIGSHHESIEHLNYRLSGNALTFLDCWINWLFTGYLDEASELFACREFMLETFPTS